MTTIDERVVAMKFDNSLFEKKIQTTLGSLDDLKNAMNMESVADSVSNISSKFSAFGAVAFTALQSLTNSAIGFGKQIADSVTEPLIEGGKRRSQAIAQAKFQFKGLGMDVEKSMEDALYAVKGTAFGLDAAASAAAAFGGSGITAGKEMKAALRGISGIAAQSGQSYERITGIFTAAAGSGRVMGDTLARLGDVSINAAAILGKELGKSEADIRKMASKGEISFKQFAKIMDNTFGANATKANEVFSGALGNMNAALARIGAAFFDIKLEGQRQMFNALAPAIDNVKAALEPVINFYEKMTKYSTQNFVDLFEALNTPVKKDGLPDAFMSLKNVFRAVIRIIRPIIQAFQEVFPPKTKEQIMEIAAAVEAFTRKLIISKDTEKGVRAAFVTFFTAIKMGVDTVGAVFRVLFNTLGNVFSFIGAIVGVIAPFVQQIFALGNGTSKVTADVGSFADAIINLQNSAIKPVVGFLNGLAEAIRNMFAGGDNVAGGFQKAFAPLGGIADWIRTRWEALGNFFQSVFKPMGDGVASGWKNVGNVFVTLWSVVKAVGKAMGDFFSGFGSGMGNFLKDIDLETILAAINTGVVIYLAVGIKKAFSLIASAFTAVIDLKGGLLGIMDGVTGTLEAMQTKLKAEALLKIAIGIGVLAVSLAVLATIDPDRLLSAATGLATSAAVLMGAMFTMSKITGFKAAATMPLIGAAMIQLATAVTVLATAVKIMGSLNPEQLTAGLIGISVAMGLLVGAAYALSGLGKSLPLAAGSMIIMAAAITAVAGAVAIFGVMPMDMLIQGGIAVAAVLVGLVGAAMLLSKYAPSMVLSAVGLMAMAAAINMLIIPITTLGLLPMPILIQGLLTLAIVLGGMVLFAQQLATSAPNILKAAVALMAMAVAINLLIAPIITLGLLPIPTLIQGIIALAAVMAVLVIAANAMQSAIVGAGAMIVMAGAILILSLAIGVMAGIGLEGIIVALIGLAAAFLVIGVAALVLAPLTPVILALGGALALLGLGMLALSATVLVFALGLMMLGPALLVAAGGLLAFAQVAPKIAEAVPAFLGIGAGLLVFGLGAAVAGVGILVLGAALVVLGVGLAMVGAVGLIGATALGVVADKIAGMIWIAPQLAAMGAAFAVLGAGVVVLGAGLLVLAAAVILTAVGLLMLIPVGAAAAAAMMILMNAVTSLVPIAGKIDMIGNSFKNLGTATALLSSTGRAAAAGIKAMASSFSSLGASSNLAAVSIVVMALNIRNAVPAIITALTLIPMAFKSMSSASLAVMSGFAVGITASSGQVAAAASSLGQTLGVKVAGGINQARLPVGIAVVALGVNMVTTLNRVKTTVTTNANSMTKALGASIANGIRGSYGTVNTAGTGIGSNIISGMQRGLQNGSYLVTNAARSVARTALNAAKDELGIHSPSREFEKLGKFSAQGFAKGLKGSRDQIQAAWETMRDLARAAYKAANEDIKKSQERIKKLRDSRKEDAETLKDLEKQRAARKKDGKDTDALDRRIKKLKKTREDERKEIEKEKKALAESNAEKRKAKKAIDYVNGALKDQRNALKEQRKLFDEKDKAVKAAQQDVIDAKKTRDDYKDSVKEQYSGLQDIDADTKLDDYKKNLQKKINDTLEFTAKMQQLRNLGLNDTMYKELLAQGTDALPFVEELLGTGKKGVTDLNKLTDTLNEAAGELGNNASKELYQAAVDSARGIRDGLQAERQAIKDKMAEIADDMVKTMKKKLGIKSPSRVFAAVGKFSDEGLAKGLKDATGKVTKASADVGGAAVGSLKKSLTDLGDVLASDIDASPTIRPVLDLDAIKKDSGLIGGMLKDPKLNVEGSYLQGLSAATAYKNGQKIKDAAAAKAGQAPIQFNQTNNSPKALSQVEIYRQTKNQLSLAKGALSK